MPRYLHIRLEAPLVAFGAPIVDNLGVIQDFPSTAALTGLIGNALGWDRSDFESLQGLQNRLIYGVRIDRKPSLRFIDFQTAKIEKDDVAWTTRGIVEGRPGGGADKYKSPHLRYRHIDADACLSVVLRLDPVDHSPNLNDIANALQHPARPLFLGRKHCLPSGYLFVGFFEAGDVLDALKTAPSLSKRSDDPLYRAYWPEKHGNQESSSAFETTDCRNWSVGVHAGQSIWKRGEISLKNQGESE